jgi:hypothetical protein
MKYLIAAAALFALALYHLLHSANRKFRQLEALGVTKPKAGGPEDGLSPQLAGGPEGLKKED